jgi:phosphoglycolate phosphatase
MAKLSNIDAIILDKDGVFNNFHKVWLRVIAYRAQKIAELSAETSDALKLIRTACIRAMGVDEKDETIDPYGPCSMPLACVRLALATTLFTIQNEANPKYGWNDAFKTIDDAIAEAEEELSVIELSESFPGALTKIKALSKAGFALGVYTSDGVENTAASLEKFKITKQIQATQAGEVKTTDLYILLCEELGVQPKNTMMITDSPHDLSIAKAAGAKTVLVLTGIISPNMNLKTFKKDADQVIDSLAKFDLSQISMSKKKTKTK